MEIKDKKEERKVNQSIEGNALECVLEAIKEAQEYVDSKPDNPRKSKKLIVENFKKIKKAFGFEDDYEDITATQITEKDLLNVIFIIYRQRFLRYATRHDKEKPSEDDKTHMEIIKWFFRIRLTILIRDPIIRMRSENSYNYAILTSLWANLGRCDCVSSIVKYVKLINFNKDRYFTIDLKESEILNRSVTFIRQIINPTGVPREFLTAFQHFNLPEEQAEVEKLPNVSEDQQALSALCEEILTFIPEKIYIFKNAPFAGITLPEGRIGINVKFVLDFPQSPIIAKKIDTAKVVLILLHELANCKKLMIQAKKVYFDPRLRSDAGIYYEEKVFGQDIIHLIGMIKREEEADEILNMETWKSTDRLRAIAKRLLDLKEEYKEMISLCNDLFDEFSEIRQDDDDDLDM